MPRKASGQRSPGDWTQQANDYRKRAVKLTGRARDESLRRAELLESAVKMQAWLRPTNSNLKKV